MDRLLLFQAIVYFVIFVLGLATSISSGIARDNFHGTCILYGSANCTNATDSGSLVFYITPGRVSLCTFLPAINLIVGVLYGLFAFCYHAYHTHRSKIYSRTAYQMGLKKLCAAAVIAVFLTIISAISLSTGLRSWCGSVLTSASLHTTQLTSCRETQSPDYTWMLANITGESTEQKVYPGEYFYEYSVAQTSCWLSVVLWTLVSGLCVYRLVKNHQHQNSYQDPFIMETGEDAFS